MYNRADEELPKDSQKSASLISLAAFLENIDKYVALKC
jgi:hypothetical protein